MSETSLPAAPAWIRATAALVAHLPAGRYRLISHLCRRPPAPFLMQMRKDMGGYLVQCDLRDGISREVCFTGRYEPQETVVVQSILRPGMSFVDVGANWGYFTLLAANLVGRDGRVLSLEPDPRLFSALEENVNRSQLNQVTVLKIAAADKTSILTLAGYDESGENFGVSRVTSKSNGHSRTFQVNAESLDRLLDRHELQSVDLMKMDIEGAEGFALAGLTEALSEKRVKRLLLELHPQLLAEHGDTAANLMEQLQQFGYQAWTIDHSPSVTRQVAYKENIDLGLLLRPISPGESLDAWPHQLWLAPGTKL